MKKLKILFITTQLPYPPISGGVIKTYYLIKHLSKTHHVQLACFLKNDDEANQKGFLEKVELQEYKGISLNVSRSIPNILKSYLRSTTLNNYRNRHTGFRKLVKQQSMQSDLLFVDHYEMFQYVPKNCKAKIVLHTHNAEFALWKRMSNIDGNPFKKLMLALEAKRVLRAEKAAIEQADLIFATPSDISLYKKEGIHSPHFQRTYHLGNDEFLYKRELFYHTSQKCILFVGTLGWEPNVHGLLWFLKEVWPSLQENVPDLVFYIVGKKADKRLMQLNLGENVIFTGFVEDLEEYYSKARAVVVPLKFGSGMKVKLLEAMYRGIPIVSTSVGAEGIQLKCGENAFIEDEADQFALKIERLITDPEKWSKFSKNSRQLAKEKYCWKDLFEEMDKELQKLFSSSKSS